MNESSRISRIVRNFLFGIVNKEFLIFLFFLFVSGAFWLMMTLNEDAEKELKIPVRLTGVPRNVVITSDVTDTVRVNLKDKGYMLLPYVYGEVLQPVSLTFKNYDKGNGRASVTSSELLKLIKPMLFKSTVVTSVKPDRWDITYNFGESKKVPVRLKGSIVPNESYFLSNVIIEPEMVTVYASRQKLDSIRSIYTNHVKLKNLNDTIVKDISLHTMNGVKIVPSEVKVTFCPDVLTEESVEVPIRAVNMPQGKVLRTFPSKVRVIFTTGASMFRNIQVANFSVIVDYEDIKNHPSEKCAVRLKAVPHGVRNARTEVETVDYLIEEQ